MSESMAEARGGLMNCSNCGDNSFDCDLCTSCRSILTRKSLAMEVLDILNEIIRIDNDIQRCKKFWDKEAH